MSESEFALVGAALNDAGTLDVAGLPPEAFAEPHCRRAWRIIADMHLRGVPVDPITVADADDGVLESSQLSAWYLEPCLPAAVPYHAGLVREDHTRRTLVNVADGLCRIEKGDDINDAVYRAIAALSRAVSSEGTTGSEIPKVLATRLEAVLNAKREGTAVSTVETGIKNLDRTIGGLPVGVATVVAGRPGMGKSAFCLTLAENVAKRGEGVHVFSLEDSADMYVDRILCRAASVPTDKIRRPTGLTDTQIFHLQQDTRPYMDLRHWQIDDSAGMSAADVVMRARAARSRLNTRLVIVDYIQLLKRPWRGASQHEAISENIKMMADAAKTDNVSYVVVSQLNRSVEQRPDKRPQMSDLRESGSLEERSNCILALYRGFYYGLDSDDSMLDIMVLKNSFGDVGGARVTWHGPTMTIT